jgi:hypothetical protein
MSQHTLTKQLDIALTTLREFAACDLNEQNCASLEVAVKRIQYRAKRTLEDIREASLTPGGLACERRDEAR